MTEEVYAYKRAETDDGEVIGDALVRIGPEDPDYAYWRDYWKREKEWMEKIENEEKVGP